MAELQQEYTLYFDGKGDYIDIEDDSSLRPDKYTMEIWVKTDGVPDEYITTIAAKGNSYGIWLNNSGGISHRYSSDYGNNIACDIEGSVILPDLWHHVAVTNDGAKVRTYVDGDLKKEDEVQGILNPAPDTFLRIGIDPEETNPTSTKNAFKGNLTELRLWNKARSQSEIKSTMFKRLVGYEESLIGYWPLDSIDSNVAIDRNANENDGKIYGATIEGQLPSIAPKDIQIGESIYTRQSVLKYPFPIYNIKAAPSTLGDKPTVDIRNVPLFSNAITVACWAKRPAGSTNWGGSNIPLVVRTNGTTTNANNHHWMLYVSNTNNIYFKIKINGTFRSATYTPTKDDPLDLTQWHHYAATYDGYVIRLYVNGVEKALANYSGQIDDGNEPIYIGYNYYRHSGNYIYYQQLLHGEIAQVQLWNRVLSDGTIKESMFKSLKGDEEGLVGYWLLNEGQGELAFDKIPNYSSHHGKLSPKATWSDQLPIGTAPSNWGTAGSGTGGPGTGGETDSGIGGSTEAGKTYQIASPSGLVLTVLGNIGYDSADIQGGFNQGTDGQKWTITEEGILKNGLGDFALDIVPVEGDDTKQSVQIKALDPSSPTQKWELTDNGHLKNKSNDFVVVLMEYAGYQGFYFVDAFAPSVLPFLPAYSNLCEYTWQFNEV